VQHALQLRLRERLRARPTRRRQALQDHVRRDEARGVSGGMMRSLIAIVLGSGCLLAAGGPAGPVADADETGRGAAPPRTAEPSRPQLRRPDFSTYRSALEDFYGRSAYAPKWLTQDAPWREALDELAAAPTHGLDAADYDVAWLRGELDAIAKGDDASARRP